MDSEREAQVRERAYEIWESEGRPDGRDAAHWERAEREIAGGSPVPPQGTGSEDGLGTTSGTEPVGTPPARQPPPDDAAPGNEDPQRG